MAVSPSPLFLSSSFFPLTLFFFSLSSSFPPCTAGAGVRQRDSALPAPLPESSFSVALDQHLHSLDKHVKGRGRNKTPTGEQSYTEWRKGGKQRLWRRAQTGKKGEHMLNRGITSGYIVSPDFIKGCSWRLGPLLESEGKGPKKKII